MRLGGVLAGLGLLLGSCGEPSPGGPVRVSVIDDGRAGQAALAPEQAALIGATTRGLVRLDADGQVAPDAALRWAILEDGRDYIFRIDDEIPAHVAVRKLRAAIAAPAARRLRPSLAAIERIAAVTPTVVEIRLSTPSPELLVLLARPELAIAGTQGAMAAHRQRDGMLLTPRDPVQGAAPVLLRGERAGKAVARFMVGGADLVLGGTFESFGVVRAAAPRSEALRIDPAVGLFGFAVRSPLLVEAPLVRALGLAIDRDRILAVIGAPGLAKATTVAGSTIEAPLEQRRAEALRLVAGKPLEVRVAMPDSPTAAALFRLVQQDWARIGVAATRVAPGGQADLALVDMVAPAESLHRLACAISLGCDPRDPVAQLDPGFIPLAAPLRWSLAARRVDAFTLNPTAAHPLDRLVSARRRDAPAP